MPTNRKMYKELYSLEENPTHRSPIMDNKECKEYISTMSRQFYIYSIITNGEFATHKHIQTWAFGISIVLVVAQKEP